MNQLLSNLPLSRLTDLGLLILRAGAGIMMAVLHGYSKFQKVTAGGEVKFGDPIGIGPYPSLLLTTFAEFFCSILLIIGLKSRLATIPLMITMLVIIFVAHAGDPLGDKETPILYLLAYFTIFVYGGGRYSLDELIRKK